MSSRGRKWSDREIVDVAERARPGARITGKLVDRGEGDPRIAGDDFFRAVAVVGIEIPDRDALGAVLQRVEGGDGDVIKITKPHRVIARGVMTRRPHQAECGQLRLTKLAQLHTLLRQSAPRTQKIFS